MDYINLAIFLFIALGNVTTLGSPTTAIDDFDKFDDSEEFEGLMRMRSNQSDNNLEKDTAISTKVQAQTRTDLRTSGQGDQKTKRQIDKIAAAALTLEVLKSLLDTISGTNRKIAIGIANESGYRWGAINVYFFTGVTDEVLTRTVNAGEAMLFKARRRNSYFPFGVMGVLTYCIIDIDQTLAVMFSVPYTQSVYVNVWNVKLFSGYQKASYSMLGKMYGRRGRPLRADASWDSIDLGHGLKAEGAMATSGAATLQIKVSRKGRQVAKPDSGWFWG